jgi:hypothetical protein
MTQIFSQLSDVSNFYLWNFYFYFRIHVRTEKSKCSIFISPSALIHPPSYTLYYCTCTIKLITYEFLWIPTRFLISIYGIFLYFFVDRCLTYIYSTSEYFIEKLFFHTFYFLSTILFCFITLLNIHIIIFHLQCWNRRMLVGFTTTCATSAYHH